MGDEPTTTAVSRRPCGCVAEAGHPGYAGEIRRAAKRAGHEYSELPTAEFRALPWVCPKCDVGEARAAERDRCASIARSRAAAEAGRDDGGAPWVAEDIARDIMGGT